MITTRSFFFFLLRINKSFLLQWKGQARYLCLEPQIENKKDYKKFLNNDGVPTKAGENTDLGQKCVAFAHWSYLYTERRLLLCDLQGNRISVFLSLNKNVEL